MANVSYRRHFEFTRAKPHLNYIYRLLLIHIGGSGKRQQMALFPARPDHEQSVHL